MPKPYIYINMYSEACRVPFARGIVGMCNTINSKTSRHEYMCVCVRVVRKRGFTSNATMLLNSFCLALSFLCHWLSCMYQV